MCKTLSGTHGVEALTEMLVTGIIVLICAFGIGFYARVLIALYRDGKWHLLRESQPCKLGDRSNAPRS